MFIFMSSSLIKTQSQKKTDQLLQVFISNFWIGRVLKLKKRVLSKKLLDTDTSYITLCIVVLQTANSLIGSRGETRSSNCYRNVFKTTSNTNFESQYFEKWKNQYCSPQKITYRRAVSIKSIRQHVLGTKLNLCKNASI